MSYTVSKDVAEKMFANYLDSIPDDRVYSGMSEFYDAVLGAGGQLFMLSAGGYEMTFNCEQDLLFFLLKWQ
jgi:hypothetical protein